MKSYPTIRRADVIRARHAYRSVVDLPEIERISVQLFGEEVVYAPHTLAPRKGPKGAAQRIAEIWDKMTQAERDHFHQVLVAQVGEITDTLPIDVGAAARHIVEAQAAGRVGDTRDIPGLREAVFELARCWQERGGPVVVGNAFDPPVVGVLPVDLEPPPEDGAGIADDRCGGEGVGGGVETVVCVDGLGLGHLTDPRVTPAA